MNSVKNKNKPTQKLKCRNTVHCSRVRKNPSSPRQRGGAVGAGWALLSHQGTGLVWGRSGMDLPIQPGQNPISHLSSHLDSRGWGTAQAAALPPLFPSWGDLNSLGVHNSG